MFLLLQISKSNIIVYLYKHETRHTAAKPIQWIHIQRPAFIWLGNVCKNTQPCLMLVSWAICSLGYLEYYYKYQTISNAPCLTNIYWPNIILGLYIPTEHVIQGSKFMYISKIYTMVDGSNKAIASALSL
jgi:hypothetical protein